VKPDIIGAAMECLGTIAAIVDVQAAVQSINKIMHKMYGFDSRHACLMSSTPGVIWCGVCKPCNAKRTDVEILARSNLMPAPIRAFSDFKYESTPSLQSDVPQTLTVQGSSPAPVI
jgi:hypothetical protein